MAEYITRKGFIHFPLFCRTFDRIFKEQLSIPLILSRQFVGLDKKKKLVRNVESLCIIHSLRPSDMICIPGLNYGGENAEEQDSF